MKIIIALLIFFPLLSGCGTFRAGWIKEDEIQAEEQEDNTKVEGIEGPTGGHFTAEGEWIPDNEEIAMTYRIPDIGAGFIFDLHSMDVTPSIQIELLEISTHIPYIGTLKLDGGVGYQRSYIYLGKLWTNIFEISTGGFVGWDWEDNDWSYGVGATIIRF